MNFKLRVGPLRGRQAEARRIDPSARLAPQPSEVPRGAVKTRTVAGADAIIALRGGDDSSQWEAIWRHGLPISAETSSDVVRAGQRRGGAAGHAAGRPPGGVGTHDHARRDPARPDREAHPRPPHPVTWAASLAGSCGNPECWTRSSNLPRTSPPRPAP